MTTESFGPVAQVTAEFLGTMFLLAAIVGSGAMAASLTDDVGLQLLQNALATAATLGALIVTFGMISGAHFNPAVTVASRLLRRISTGTAAAFVAAQLAGAATGVIVANVMFSRPAVERSATGRAGAGLALGEGVATFGLLAVVFCAGHFHRLPVVAAAVATYIAGAFAFTSSTSFANPAVTMARTLTDSFAGIDPSSVPAFLIAQAIATGVAVVAVRALLSDGVDAGRPP
ncbi:MAG: aquaporin [Actinomycetota bacterium]